MRFILIATLVTIGLLVSFIAGVFNGNNGLSLLGFCGAPFAIFTLGLAVGRSGYKLALLGPEPIHQAVNHREVTPRKSLLTEKMGVNGKPEREQTK